MRWILATFPWAESFAVATVPNLQRGARIMGAVALTPTRSGSGEADIARASQVQHTIEDVGGDVHLGRPTLLRMRA